MSSFEELMLPCFWKQTFGIECLGCGIQRSLSLLIHGDFVGAFYMYPAIYSLILLFIFLIIHLKFQLKNGHKIILGLFILNISIIIINYYLKHF
ncbi:DUF2752 domain-containing protein [Psychroserpens mesophilus]|uniref:DUF2752 domain-containing protein n=1 Tax=Psychroserpens mesophilus TaxID=325473 RepID=UPI000590466E|nr:DUF2752 domain-containing protein [Psychroserpens mesophilus]